MGIENLFNKRRTQEKTTEPEEIDHTRRGLMVGGAALAGASMLPFKEAQASDLPELEEIKTPEGREDNVAKILAYAAWIKQNESAFARATSQTEIKELAFKDLPALGEQALEGTELDYKEFMKKGGWPSALIRWNRKVVNPKTNAVELSPRYANSFAVNNEVVLSGHVAGDIPGCERSAIGLDLATCSFDNKSVVPDEEARKHRAQTQLSWDPNTANKNLHGQIVFIPASRLASDGTLVEELLPAVLIRITPNFLYTPENPQAFFNKETTELAGHDLINSYMAVTAPQNLVSEETRNYEDVKGQSGTPVITLESCQQGKKSVCGDIWGAFWFSNDEGKEESRTGALVHGPEGLASSLEQVGKNYNSENFDRITITRKIQEALNEWAQKNRKETIVVDGDYGLQTQRATLHFQRATFGNRNENILYDTTGTVNQRTWEALFPSEPFVDVFLLPQ